MAVDIEAAQHYHRVRTTKRFRRREIERQQWLQRTRDAVALLAPRFSAVHQVVIFGSLVKPGRFGESSDIDIAVICDDIAVESAFWRALEQALDRPVDLRPLTGALTDVVNREGERVYG